MIIWRLKMSKDNFVSKNGKVSELWLYCSTVFFFFSIELSRGSIWYKQKFTQSSKNTSAGIDSFGRKDWSASRSGMSNKKLEVLLIVVKSKAEWKSGEEKKGKRWRVGARENESRWICRGHGSNSNKLAPAAGTRSRYKILNMNGRFCIRNKLLFRKQSAADENICRWNRVRGTRGP